MDVLDAFDLRIKAKFADVCLERSQMHDYQHTGYEFLMANPFSGLFIDMGLGKTVTSATVICDLLANFDNDDKVLIIAPLRVATATWPDEFRRWRHLAPFNFSVIHVYDDDPRLREARLNAVRASRAGNEDRCMFKSEIEKEAAEAGRRAEAQKRHELREAAANSSASIHIISRDWIEWLVSFYAKPKGGSRWPYRTVIVDECFVAGTTVLTPDGERAIETIGVGDFVMTPYGNRPVEWVHSAKAHALVKVIFEDGRATICTPNHRFLTASGWKTAQDIAGEITYDESELSTRHLLTLWGDVLASEVDPSVLREIVQAEISMGNETRRIESGNKRGNGRSGFANAMEQGSIVERGSEGEASRIRPDSAGCVSESPWRKREGYVKARKDDEPGARSRLGVQSCDKPWGEAAGLPDELQSRFCVGVRKDSVGSGWGQPQATGTQGAGRKENRSTGSTRVVSVEVIECGSGVDVYDLTVDGAPFYYANGALVHNCSGFKDYASNRFMALASIRNTPGLITRLHILTATPAAETYESLFAQIFLLDRGERFGIHITKFRKKYFNENKWAHKWEIREGAEEEITAKIADICMVMKAKDYLDMEEPIYVRREVELRPTERELYDTMATEMIVNLADGTKVEAKTAAALSQKLSQMASGVLYDSQIAVGDDPDDPDARIKINKVHHIHDHKIDMLKQIVEESQGQPIMVGYCHRASLDRLRRHFPKAVVMDKAGKCRTKWNKGQIPILLMHPASGGHGLNLQAGGHIVVYFDIPWSLELYQQFIGRLARQGQTKQVTVFLIVCKGTMDERVVKALGAKNDAQDLLFKLLQSMRRKFAKMAKAAAAEAIAKALSSSKEEAELDL